MLKVQKGRCAGWGHVCVSAGKYILNEMKCNARIRIIMDRIQMTHPIL